MNKARVKKLLKVSGKVAELIEELNNILSDEQDYYSNLSEKMQESEKGDLSGEAIAALENAISELEDAQASIDSTTGEID